MIRHVRHYLMNIETTYPLTVDSAKTWTAEIIAEHEAAPKTLGAAVAVYSAVTSEELDAFVAAVSATHEAGLKAEYPTCNLNWERIEHSTGRRYARLFTLRPEVTDITGNAEIIGYRASSAFAFIDLTNGAILKPAGYNTPAKHARGNIRKGDASNLWNGAFTNHGGGLHVAYLR